MEQTFWKLLAIIILDVVPFSQSACFANQSYASDNRTTHFTYNGEVLPIFLEGSLVYRPTLDFLNNIVMILGSEVLGYADIRIVEPKLSSPTETSLALSRVAGCDGLENSCPSNRPPDSPVINMAVWMSSPVAPGSWPAEGNSQVKHKGNHALYGRYGWYVSTDIVSTMWEGSNVVGDHWRSLQNTNYISALSLSDSLINEYVDDGKWSSYCDRPECVRGIYHPPWCNNQTLVIGSDFSDCAILLADYPGK